MFPPVKAVLIYEIKNKIEEIRIDISKDPYQLLKGSTTFIGQWPEINVVIMKNKTSMFELADNRNTLPDPFHRDNVKGPILLIRMNEDAEPEDFTIEEYKKFMESKASPVENSLAIFHTYYEMYVDKLKNLVLLYFHIHRVLCQQFVHRTLLRRIQCPSHLMHVPQPQSMILVPRIEGC